MVTFTTLRETANEMIDTISEECLRQVLTQFQNLLDAGVLVVKRQKPCISLRQSPSGGFELHCESGIELSFRGEEEITRLKEENAKLQARLTAISHAIKEIPNG